MKTPKTLAIAAALVIGGLNVSGQTISSSQVAYREVTELKTYVIAITPDEERQLLRVEKEYAKGMRNANNTIDDYGERQTEQKRLWNNMDVEIKAILTPDQFKEYLKVDRIEKYNSRNGHDSRLPRVYFV